MADGARLDTLGGEGSFLVSYGGTSDTVTLSDFRRPFVLGDLNLDGRVDRIDTALVVQNLGLAANADLTDGDLDDDDAVTLADLAILRLNMGHTHAPSPSLASVPEPSALVLAALACAILGLYTPRRR